MKAPALIAEPVLPVARPKPSRRVNLHWLDSLKKRFGIFLPDRFFYFLPGLLFGMIFFLWDDDRLQLIYDGMQRKIQVIAGIHFRSGSGTERSFQISR